MVSSFASFECFFFYSPRSLGSDFHAFRVPFSISNSRREGWIKKKKKKEGGPLLDISIIQSIGICLQYAFKLISSRHMFFQAFNIFN